MTSISLNFSQNQKPEPAADYGPPPRLPEMTQKDLDNLAATKKTESLSGTHFKQLTINEPNLNRSLLETEKDFQIYPSFLRPETTEDEIQRLSSTEKTSQLALASFPGSQSSSSSSSSLKGPAPTIGNSPVFSLSEDPFGGRIEPSISEYLPGFFLGNKGRFEAESLSSSKFSASEEKAHPRNTKKRSASLQMDKGTEPIKEGSMEFERVLEKASQHRALAPTFREYQSQLETTSGSKMLLADFTKCVDRKKKGLKQIKQIKITQIGDGISPIKFGSEEFEQVVKEASQPRAATSTFERYQLRLRDAANLPITNDQAFRKLVKKWKKEHPDMALSSSSE